MSDFWKQRWGAVLALCAVVIVALVLLLDRRAPAKSGAVAAVEGLPMTPCREYATCNDKCLMAYRLAPAARRDESTMRSCLAGCEQRASVEARTLLLMLRTCEEQSCKDLPPLPNATPAELTRRGIACAEEKCGPDRTRCGLSPDDP